MADKEKDGGEQAGPRSAQRAAWSLFTIVFTSGAVLMGMEMAGSRILAPSFGTGIFVWGALIGLFMGAMALGYYVGGKLADRYPSFPVLATIVSLAGAYIYMIPYIGHPLCESVGRSVTDQMAGPLIAAALLFFVPSFLMAMVSPYAVKLNTTTLSGVGGVAGTLYALSTFGSIVGTLLTTFVLIPTFWVSNVLQGLGLALVLVAILTLVLFRSALGRVTKDDRNGAALMAVVALGLIEMWALFPVQPHVANGERLLFYEESRYHDIAITEVVYGSVPSQLSPSDGRCLLRPDDVSRWMKFNENRESGIFPYGEYLNAVRYTNVVHLALLWVPDPKSMLVVGGGGGVVPVQFRKFYGKTLEKVDVLELDPSVQTAALDYFQMHDDAIQFKIGDARMNLKKSKEKYDIILLDAYGSGGQIPFHLMTYEFLEDVKAHLTERGVLVTNIIAALENENPPKMRPGDLFFAEFKTLTQAHPRNPVEKPALYDPQQIYIFPRTDKGMELRNRETENRNIILIAVRETERKSRNDLLSLAQAFVQKRERNECIDRDVFLWNAESVYVDGPTDQQLAEVPVLTDHYAPVDTMYRPVKYDELIWRIR